MCENTKEHRVKNLKTYPMPTEPQHSTAMKEEENYGFRIRKTAQNVARTEKERSRNIFTFFTSNRFLLEPEEVDAIAGESTSIPSGSAILLILPNLFDLRKLSCFVTSPLYLRSQGAKPS